MSTNWYWEFTSTKRPWVKAFTTFMDQKGFFKNEGVYDSFNDNQLAIIKSYSRWRTKNMYKSMLRDPIKDRYLQVSPTKEQQLKSLMGSYDDWEYDGIVDTGYMGGGHCTLGHALRYEHYAFTAKGNKRVIFGIKCASDFFQISEDMIKRLKKVQESIMNETKMIAFVIQGGGAIQYAKDHYDDILEIAQYYGDQLEEIWPYGMKAQMIGFYNAGIPLTDYFLNYLNSARVKMKREREILEREEKEKQKALYFDNYINAISDGDAVIKKFLLDKEVKNRDLGEQIRDYLVEDFRNDLSEEDMKKRKALARLAMNFSRFELHHTVKRLADMCLFDCFVVTDIQASIFTNSVKHGEFNLVTSKDMIQRYRDIANNKRTPLSAVYLRKEFVPIITESDEYYETVKGISNVVRTFRGQDGVGPYAIRDVNNFPDFIESKIMGLYESFKFAIKNKKELEKHIIDKRNEMILKLNNELPTVKEVVNMPGVVLQYTRLIYVLIKDNEEKEKISNALFNINEHMWSNDPTKKNIVKQLSEFYIKQNGIEEKKAVKANAKEVKKINKEDFGDYSDIFDAKSLVDKAKIINKYKENESIAAMEFPLQVAFTVEKYKRCSPKQEKHIERAYSALKGSIEKEVKGTEAKELTLESIQEAVSPENSKIPSLIEMSEALGIGALTVDDVMPKDEEGDE